MASGLGWGWAIILVLISTNIFISRVKAIPVLTVTEGEPFNITCTYGLPGYWTIHPLLVNTEGQGEGECTERNGVTYYQCSVNRAQLTNSGNYTFSILPSHNPGTQLDICHVQITVQIPYVEKSSSSIKHNTITSISSLSSFTSSSSLLVIIPTTSSSRLSSSLTITTSITNTAATTATNTTPIVPIIVPVVIVGLLISISLIVLSVAVIWVTKSRKKRPRINSDHEEDDDTGFLIGKEQSELFNATSNSLAKGVLSQPQSISFRSILFQELIGSQSGPVLVHHASIKRKDVLVKQLKEKRGHEDLSHEISILKDLASQDYYHPNIISFIGTTSTPDPLCLVLEYLPHGSLYDLIQSLYKGPIPQWYIGHVLNSPRGLYNNKQISADLFSILIQVTKGAQYLAELGLVHGHLSTKNIILGRNLVAKISNFSVPKSGEHFIKTDRESFLQDLAPEVISDGEHTAKSDIWSFGVMIYRVATFESHKPFKKISPNLIHSNIIQGTRPPPLPCFSKELYFQMQQCWKLQAEERPDFKQLLNTLEILSQSSWSHLLFEISEKRKSYINENHQIYLFPLLQTTVSNTAKRLLQRSGSIADDTTSGFASSVVESGDDVDQKENVRSKIKRMIRKQSSDKISSHSQLISSSHKKVPQRSLVEDFERSITMNAQEISRTNPLNINNNNTL